MATQETEVKWLGDHVFDVTQNEHHFRIDGNPDLSASTGVRPKALMLSALAGCTGLDVVDILNKMRVEFSEFSMKVIGTLTEETPKVYETVTLAYSIRLSNPDDRIKMEKAVHLSQEKYCGVAAMIRRFAELKVEIVFL